MEFRFIYCTLIYLILSTQGLLITVTTPHNSMQRNLGQEQRGQHANSDMVVAVKLGRMVTWGWLLSQDMLRCGSSYQVRVHRMWQWLPSQGMLQRDSSY
jgi:hypothetical protein